MPLVTLRYAPAAAIDGPATKAAAARLVTRLAADLLGKRPDLTAVVVTVVDPADWFVGGRSLAASGLGAYALGIIVTEGTNTKAEKARFLAAVHDGLAELVGPLHPESYVHVEEARADAYGYAGLSQEWRFVAGAMDDALKAERRERALAVGVR